MKSPGQGTVAPTVEHLFEAQSVNSSNLFCTAHTNVAQLVELWSPKPSKRGFESFHSCILFSSITVSVSRFERGGFQFESEGNILNCLVV